MISVKLLAFSKEMKQDIMLTQMTHPVTKLFCLNRPMKTFPFLLLGKWKLATPELCTSNRHQEKEKTVTSLCILVL